MDIIKSQIINIIVVLCLLFVPNNTIGEQSLGGFSKLKDISRKNQNNQLYDMMPSKGGGVLNNYGEPKSELPLICKLSVEIPGFNKAIGYIKGDEIWADFPWAFDKKIGYFKGDDIYIDVPWAFDEKIGYISGDKVKASIPWAIDKSVGYVEGKRIKADIPWAFDETVGWIVEGNCGIKGAGAFFVIYGALKEPSD